MPLALAYYDDPILRKKAEEIVHIDASIRQLAYDMSVAMDHYHGTGLAAPQVKRSVRLFVARLSEKEEFEEWVKEPIEVFINPVLSQPSSQICEEVEGCLSIPGVRASVPRPASIRVQAVDLDGCVIDRVYTGYLARILMHENDHLNGVLYIDHLSKSARKQIEPKLKQVRRKYKS